jgi:hypothetical protein
VFALVAPASILLPSPVHRQGLPRLRFLHYQEQRTRWTAAERRDVCDAQACHAQAWMSCGPSRAVWFPSPRPEALAAREPLLKSRFVTEVTPLTDRHYQPNRDQSSNRTLMLSR